MWVVGCGLWVVVAVVVVGASPNWTGRETGVDPAAAPLHGSIENCIYIELGLGVGLGVGALHSGPGPGLGPGPL